MKRFFIAMLSLMLLLSGCGDEQGNPPAQPENPAPGAEQTQQPSVEPETEPGQQETPPHSGESEVQQPVSLTFSQESTGEWPLDCTLETIQFVGRENTELDRANVYLQTNTDDARQRYLDCAALNEDQRWAEGASWCDIWAYPVSGERYLNAVIALRERMHFRVEHENPWNLVDSVVYDKQEDRVITLDEALARAEIDLGDLERAVCQYAAETELGVCEKVNSAAFYMAEDTTPVFMVSAIIRESDDILPWPMFFIWTDGVVELMSDHPLPLYLVDTYAEELSCLQGMGQYDGAAVISEEEAADILSEIYEVQEYLALGMRMMFDGTAEWIDSEYCVCISLCTDQGESFVREVYYAVSYDAVYRLNPVNGTWEVVGFG